MPRHQRPKVGDDGWCEWIYPHMDDYRLACCDCGLVHQMEMKIVRVEYRPDGTMLAKDLRSSSLSVKFRARRHARATAQTRRHKRNPASR
jgi:hypothetical protein